MYSHKSAMQVKKVVNPKHHSLFYRGLIFTTNSFFSIFRQPWFYHFFHSSICSLVLFYHFIQIIEKLLNILFLFDDILFLFKHHIFSFHDIALFFFSNSVQESKFLEAFKCGIHLLSIQSFDFCLNFFMTPLNIWFESFQMFCVSFKVSIQFGNFLCMLLQNA